MWTVVADISMLFLTATMESKSKHNSAQQLPSQSRMQFLKCLRSVVQRPKLCLILELCTVISFNHKSKKKRKDGVHYAVTHIGLILYSWHPLLSITHRRFLSSVIYRCTPSSLSSPAHAQPKKESYQINHWILTQSHNDSSMQ